MNKIVKGFFSITLLTLFVLMFIELFTIFDITINYIMLFICLIFGILLKITELYLHKKYSNHKKTIDTLINIIFIIFSLMIYIIINAQTINAISTSITIGAIDYLKVLSRASTIKSIINSVILNVLFILSYYWTKYLFIDNKPKYLLYLSLIITLIHIVIKIDVSIINIIVISLLLIIVIIDHYYANINNLNPYLFIIIISIFIVLSFSSYLLNPIMKNINIRSFINSIFYSDNNSEIDETIDYVLDSDSFDYTNLDDNTTSFIEPINNDYLDQYNDTKGEKIIDIETTYKVDRLKAYSMSTYDLVTNSFIFNKDADNSLIADTTDLFVRKNITDLKERMLVKTYNNENIVYYPYGDLSFFNTAYLYNDAIIQFVDNKNYKNYSFSFNPYVYNNELLDKLVSDNKIELSKYHKFANEKYALKDKSGSINYNNIPKQIYDSIDLFMSSYNLNDFNNSYVDNNPNDFYYETKRNVSLVNYILKTNITVTKEYETNDMGLDDISYCLLYSKKANPLLLTKLAVMMYRYFDIPTRFVTGYRINEYVGNSASIYENDKACWAEVFIAGGWRASDLLTSDSFYDSYSVNDDITGDISKAFNGDMENDPIILTLTSDYHIDRLKQSSFGDYNPEKRSFELEEDIDSYKSIKRIKALDDVDNYFKKLFVLSGDLSKNINISTYGVSNNVYIPYGNISIDNVSVYQDKKLVLEKHSDNYSYTFNPYDDNYHYSNDALYDNYVYEKYLNVPSSLEKELKDFLTDNGIDYNSNNKNQIIKQIKYLLQGGRYKYSLDVNYDTEKDYLLYFLKESKEGFCQHFAGAATLLLRVCNIPSRYTVGFIVDESSEKTIDVKASNAHAWVEVYTSNLGWCPVEVTVGEYIEFELSELFPDGINYDNVTVHLSKDNNKENKDNNESSINSNNNESYNDYPKNMSIVTSKIMNDEIEINDQVIMEVFSDNDLHYLKSFASGDYHDGSFEIEEDIDSLDSIQTIKSEYDIDNYFINFICKDLDVYSYNLKVKNYAADNYVYYPYGTIKIDDIYMYQDKCLYFNDDNNYIEYDIKYNDLNDNEVEDDNYDYENFVYEKYTSVPNEIVDALINFLNDNNINYLSSNKFETLKAIQKLLSNYSYTTKAIDSPEDIDPVVYFLIVNKKGNATHFAAAATLLYRICGIPARYVEGYYLNNKEDGYYSLTNNNKHYWTEVYSSNLGWVNIETTPNYINDEIINLNFDRHIKLENYMEFSKGKIAIDDFIVTIGSFVSIVILIVIGFVIYKTKKGKEAEYKKLLAYYGIKSDKQLKLLKDINTNYLLLKKHNYNNQDVEDIMYRIRYSKKKETMKDLKVINKHIDKMKKSENYNMSFKEIIEEYIRKVKDNIKK